MGSGLAVGRFDLGNRAVDEKPASWRISRHICFFPNHIHSIGENAAQNGMLAHSIKSPFATSARLVHSFENDMLHIVQRH